MPGPLGATAAAYWALQSRFGRYARLSRRFVRRHGLVVSSGPFAGLRYTRRTAVGRVVAKLLGSYEEELHEALDELVRAAPARIVNVGSAEGYYAVGLALALPRARVAAFESDARRRKLCGELAVANGVAGRVTLFGTCSAATLAALPEPAQLVVCDCEGAETDVLRPEAVAWLRRASLVVELHDAFVPGTTQTLRQRFDPTHAWRLVSARPRDPGRYAALAGLRAEDAREALDEDRRDRDGRPLVMQWALLSPRCP